MNISNAQHKGWCFISAGIIIMLMIKGNTTGNDIYTALMVIYIILFIIISRLMLCVDINKLRLDNLELKQDEEICREMTELLKKKYEDE